MWKKGIASDHVVWLKLMNEEIQFQTMEYIASIKKKIKDSRLQQYLGQNFGENGNLGNTTTTTWPLWCWRPILWLEEPKTRTIIIRSLFAPRFESRLDDKLLGIEYMDKLQADARMVKEKYVVCEVCWVSHKQSTYFWFLIWFWFDR